MRQEGEEALLTETFCEDARAGETENDVSPYGVKLFLISSDFKNFIFYFPLCFHFLLVHVVRSAG